jgi:hypothetical protein
MSKGKRSATVIAAIVLVAIAAGVAYASIPDSAGVIHGCYKTGGSHALRVIDTGVSGHCNGDEKPLNWNQTGPQGPAGATGATGAQGPAGESATALWAVVRMNGEGQEEIQYGSHAVSVARFVNENGSVRYEVTFDQDVSQCAYAGSTASSGFLHFSPNGGLGEEAVVNVSFILPNAGNSTDANFHLAVFC